MRDSSCTQRAVGARMNHPLGGKERPESYPARTLLRPVDPGGSEMDEEPRQDAPNSSETDPPAANQAVGEAEEERHPSSSATDDDTPAAAAPLAGTHQVVPGKPDGEVDTRPS